MGYSNVPGDPFHAEFVGEFTSSTGEDLVIYRAGETTAYTLGATEQLVVTDYQVVGDTAATVDLFFDPDDDNVRNDGALIAGGAFAANGGIEGGFTAVPRYGPPGAGISLAASTDVNTGRALVTGYILRTIT